MEKNVHVSVLFFFNLSPLKRGPPVDFPTTVNAGRMEGKSEQTSRKQRMFIKDRLIQFVRGILALMQHMFVFKSLNFSF